ncbi:MAG TPA: cytochrome c [Polyangiaceae bacterium]|jgi:mono/diheme cytochrome c family protein|nr:cytochrome c [Polyangiaceae bacterium]
MRLVLASTLVFTLAACGGAAPAANAPAGGSAAGAAPATFAEQVAAGQKLYGDNCAGCHGAGGEGTSKAPAVVGLKTGALPLDPPPTAKFRKVQFKTVADVAGFAVKAMPPNNPGGLPEADYWSILAFDLKANGIDLGSQKLDGTVAAGLTIPR